ncbi:uncharacterized protein LOC143566483 [Bidens hawaiensis]|uniref:uncharacterized protein LOC143566483 n=1 Tax=Bidens hawaiensis TaxID=980011 RepID=UPI00404B0F4D
MPQVSLVVGYDRVIWSLEEDSGFSVKSLKNGMVDHGGAIDNYVMEWNNWVPSKVGIHAWRVEMERIPVWAELSKRGIAMSSAVCPICEEEVESADHLMISCRLAQIAWSVISTWCKVPSIYAFTIRDLLEMHRYTSFSKRKAKAFYAVCLTTIWCVWRARNALVFEGNPMILNKVVGKIKTLSYLWVKHRGKNTTLTWEMWRGFKI